jgi:hypothetical protein
MVCVAVDCHYARATGGVFPHANPHQEEYMQLQRLKLFQPTVVALAAALVVGSALRSSAQDYRDSSSRTLQGTWWVQVTALSDCVSRTPLVSFSALLTFADGGTMTGTTTNPGFATGQRTPDHGVWAGRRASHTFRASSVALILFTTAPNLPLTPGFQAGSQRLDQTIALTDPDHFTSDAVTTFFDATGQKYRQGCATALGERFE